LKYPIFIHAQGCRLVLKPAKKIDLANKTKAPILIMLTGEQIPHLGDLLKMTNPNTYWQPIPAKPIKVNNAASQVILCFESMLNATWSLT
jgi:hypothetical protein